MNGAKHNLSGLADELGNLRAQMANLKNRSKAIVEQLGEAGVEILEGDLFRAVVSNVEETSGPDWKTIAQKLKPSRQMVVANQKIIKKSHVRVNVSARVGEKAAA